MYGLSHVVNQLTWYSIAFTGVAIKKLEKAEASLNGMVASVNVFLSYVCSFLKPSKI